MVVEASSMLWILRLGSAIAVKKRLSKLTYNVLQIHAVSVVLSVAK
jgi:hypothetical protein